MATTHRNSSREAHVPTAEPLLQPDILTENELQSKLNLLKNARTFNLQLRMRHAGKPDLFLQSELSLHQAIRALAPVAVSPQLYPSLIGQGALPVLKSLLQHPNEDIAYHIISFLHDLVVVDDGSDVAREAVHKSYDALLEQGIYAALSEVLSEVLLSRIADTNPDEAAPAQEATAQAFAVFENSIDVRPDLTDSIAIGSKIVETCIKHINVSQPDDAAIEVLAVFLQTSAICRSQFLKKGGLDVVMKALLPFRKQKRPSPISVEKEKVFQVIDEQEMVENLFGLLCTVLFDSDTAKVEFERLEGVELMVCFMRTSDAYRWSAAKACDFACTDHSPAVQRLLMCGGVGVVFAILMILRDGRATQRLTKKRTRAQDEDLRSMTEHVFSILFHMFKYASTTDRRRLLLKLRENRAKKSAKVIALYREYALAVEKASGEQGRYLAGIDNNTGAVSGKDMDDELLVSKLEAGFMIVQMGAVIIGHVIAYADESLRKALISMLEQAGTTIAVICETLTDYAASIGESVNGDPKPEALNERKRTLVLIKRMREATG